MKAASPSPRPAKPFDGVRAVALTEAAKGVLVLLAGFGVMAFIHRDLQGLAESLVRHAHLNPASHYPRIFIDAMARAHDLRLGRLAALSFLYVALRFVEAYGLWCRKRWAEWLAALSGGVYLPLELYELARKPTVVKAVVLLVNVVVVAVMVRALAARRNARP